MDWTDPAGAHWPDGFSMMFNALGRALAERLQTELGSSYAIRYHDFGV